jgi:hypothetical protein
MPIIDLHNCAEQATNRKELHQVVLSDEWFTPIYHMENLFDLLNTMNNQFNALLFCCFTSHAHGRRVKGH